MFLRKQKGVWDVVAEKVRARAVAAEEISGLGWVDVWEFVHDKEDPPPGWNFDFKARDEGNPRRMDRIHVPWRLTPHVGGIFTFVTTRSDHKTVILHMVPTEEMGTTRRWRFPDELLKDEESVQQLSEQLSSLQGEGELWWGSAHRDPCRGDHHGIMISAKHSWQNWQPPQLLPKRDPLPPPHTRSTVKMSGN